MADPMSDFGRLGNEYNVSQPDPALAANMQDLQRALASAGPSPQAPLQAGLQGLASLSSNMVAQQQMNANPMQGVDVSVKHDAEGNPQISLNNLTPDQVQYFSQAAQFQKEALGGFAQQAQQIQTELQRAQAQPWQQLGTALAANMANQPGMPGWVRGLGQTAAQMNPTVDQLRAQYLGTLRGGAEIAKDVRAEQIAEQRTLADVTARKEAMIVATETQRQKRIKDTMDDAAQAISKGVGRIDSAVVSKALREAGANEQEVGARLNELKLLADNVGAAFNLGREDKKAAQEAEAIRLAQGDKRLELLVKAATTKANEKSEEQKDLEALAQSLAAGELTSLRTVASMRGGRRERVFRLAREINPTFNTAEIERKVNMEQAFTVGKDGIGLQSFDTFLQHAGEAKGALENLRLSGSPAFNKPLNWMRRNMAGSPELEALEVSLEPVKKEFEKFLLNQQALYAEDRKEAEKMLNSNMSPAQILAGLNQMAKTAKDRYAAMNQRYKRVMGQDIEHPFSNEAIGAASLIGINLGQSPGIATTPGNTVNVTEDELKKLGFK